MRSPEGARAIAFDLFHTLVDPERFRPRRFVRAQEAGELLGLPARTFLPEWEATFPDRQVTLRPTILERLAALCRTHGVDARADVWARVDDAMGRYQDRAILRPDVSVLLALRTLRRQGWALGLLSNCDERERRWWNRSPLAPLFSAALFSCDIGARKPSVHAYRALVPRWGGFPLERAIYVGDGGSDELRGARRAGFSWVVFQAGYVSKNGLRPARENEEIAAVADAQVDDVGELVHLRAARSVGPAIGRR